MSFSCFSQIDLVGTSRGASRKTKGDHGVLGAHEVFICKNRGGFRPSERRFDGHVAAALVTTCWRFSRQLGSRTGRSHVLQVLGSAFWQRLSDLSSGKSI